MTMRQLRLRRRDRSTAEAVEPIVDQSIWDEAPPIDLASDDPFLAYLQGADEPVDLSKVQLDSEGVKELREAGVELVVPLVNQGELIGTLNLGRRLSDQDYSTDDRKLLDRLAGQAAPAVRVAQLVRQQEAQAQERERIEQEMRVAQLIQQTLLPRELPKLSGWEVWAYYKPARAVGGDFYDFIDLEDGRLAVVVGDVTDKGVPAALVMATCRTLLRAAASRVSSPGEILRRVNDLLVDDIPPNMFVTCLCAILDPVTGRVRYANAGHNLPYLRTGTGVVEMRAVGMPLGLMPDMTYDENEATLEPGHSFLLHSDGLAEAHNPDREMFGFPRLMGLVGTHPGGAPLIDELLSELSRFVGPAWDQEDDVTLVTVSRTGASIGGVASEEWETLGEFSVRSEPGNERSAVSKVVEAVAGVGFSERRLARLQTAVAETTMNAIEHGNRNQADLPVEIRVLRSDDALVVRVTDQGGEGEIAEPETPDLEAKMAGEQTPRGWGLYLVENMCDDMKVSRNEAHHTVELIYHLKGGRDAGDV
jgi:serine phosphatase RsbU (regulator of sigma subunit)/anti-sigma regulatory factor (Ser/Thr protein kinase)